MLALIRKVLLLPLWILAALILARISLRQTIADLPQRFRDWRTGRERRRALRRFDRMTAKRNRDVLAWVKKGCPKDRD